MSNSSTQSGENSCLCGLCAVLLLASAAAWGQGPEAPSTGPSATAPSPTMTAPAPPPTAATAPATAPGKMGAIVEALKLTDAQADSYRVAMGRKNQIDDPSIFTVFLRKVAGLPKLQGAEWGELDRPAYGSLLAHPDRYAGRPMSLRVVPNRVRKRTPGVDFRASADWTRDDGPIYGYECLWADPELRVDEPLIVLFPLEPNAVLGRPSKVEENGDCIYDNLRAVQVAGVFYKLYTDKEANTARLRDYPVVMAWQVQSADGRGITVTAENWKQALGAGIVLFVAVAAYFFWRVRLAARGIRAGGAQRPRYVLRETREEEEKKETSPEEDQTDPGLAAAAEEFRKQEKAKDS